MASEHKKKGSTKNQNSVAVDTKTALDEYRSQSIKQAETLVKEVFPKKVLELNALLETDTFKLSRLPELEQKLNIPVPEPVTNHDLNEHVTKKRKTDSHGVSNDLDLLPGCKVYALPGGSVPVNQHLVEMIEIIKPLTIELVCHANQLKMWITFLIPKIEDGNNFGVSIQEDTMGEARQIESEAATYLDQISRYYLTRGKIISKIAKYPHVDDYRKTVTELDEKEFLSLRLIVMELRNHYAALHDLITKNMDKIRKPRSSNTDNMY